MRTTKRERKVKDNHPEVRSLKIQPRLRVNRYSESMAPEIKLYGHWLEKLGFGAGQRVAVTTMKELLIIRLQPE